MMVATAGDGLAGKGGNNNHFPTERHMLVYYEVSLALIIEWVSQLRHILVDTTGQQTLQACNKRAFS